MTTDREFELFVHSWLKEGGDALSERVAAGVMADLATTAQRRALPPISRWRSLPTPTRFALASSAAVIVIAGRRRRHPPRPTRTERGADRADASREPEPERRVEPQRRVEPEPVEGSAE